MVATPKVADAYLALRNDMVLLMDLQNHMKKKDYELQVARAKLDLVKKEISARRIQGDSTPKAD